MDDETGAVQVELDDAQTKPPIWYATPGLRWHGGTLEQRWMCLQDNATEWRAVPIVQ